jgi:hypothetical protein
MFSNHLSSPTWDQVSLVDMDMVVEATLRELFIVFPQVEYTTTTHSQLSPGGVCILIASISS